MPTCSQVSTCDIPIRIDSYKGCGFNCLYCFQSKFYSGMPKPNESIQSLKKFINGSRNHLTKWCDWDIPLHFGTLSDPFQPLEKTLKRSLEFLKVFADSSYPFVLTTKSILIAEKEYLDVLKYCNVVTQLSVCSPQYDVLEESPSFNQRVNILDPLVKSSRRVIIRIQPYTHKILHDVISHLDYFSQVGVYGVLVGSVMNGSVCLKRDEFDILEDDYIFIRDEVHYYGMKFYCCDGILPGDSPTCCGCDKLKGFKTNKANLNYSKCRYSEPMKVKGSGSAFRYLYRNVGNKGVSSLSYMQVMRGLKEDQ